MTSNPQIPRRQVDLDFDPSVVPRDWFQDDPFTTTFMNSMSLLFPEGERFFVESVKQVRDQIESPELRRQIVGFIGQEAMHGKEHRAFNDQLVAHGYAEAPRVEAGLRRLLKFGRRVFSNKAQLGITCALEHFTAILAESLLKDDKMRAGIHPSVRPLWVWHALEESEHKAVAFDVYRAIGGGYLRRAGMMLFTTGMFFAVLSLVHARMMWTRGILFRPWRWVRGLTEMYLWPGRFTRMIPAYLSYFRPGFHPDDRDTSALLEQWRERLFGDDGELRTQLRAVVVEAA